MQITPTITGPVNAAGRLVLGPANRARLVALFRSFRGEVVDLAVTKHADTRSARANAYYWGVVVKLATAHTGDTAEDFHDEMCARFLARRRIEIVNYQTGEAEEVVIPGRSSRLAVGDFYTFVEQVRQFCAEFLGVVTPDPDPAYWRRQEAA